MRLARIEEALAEGERFPLVIADPPWVRSTETGGFPRDPVAAIDGGADASTSPAPAWRSSTAT
ncbi:hypothetical protein GY12_13360 [Micrococcus luteus]|nr:hypothetical protein GY12_13360 [Micrococcus luteus]